MIRRALRDLLRSHLEDLRATENAVTRSAEGVLGSAQDEGIRRGLEEYLEATAGQIDRLEEIASLVDDTIDLRLEREWLDEEEDRRHSEIALVTGLRFAAEYKLAAYRTAQRWADLLGQPDRSAALALCVSGEEAAVDRLKNLESSSGCRRPPTAISEPTHPAND